MPRAREADPRRGLALGAGLGFTFLALAACAEPAGIVEIDWAFVDRNAAAIFPGGPILETPDTCALSGRDSQGTRDYALQVRLIAREEICGGESETGETGETSDESCIVREAYFGCDRARGALTDVPPSDAPYIFELEVWATPAGESAPGFAIDPACIAVPGPRTRRVEAGRITDLAVYQLVANAIDLDDPVSGGLDLVGCRLGGG